MPHPLSGADFRAYPATMPYPCGRQGMPAGNARHIRACGKAVRPLFPRLAFTPACADGRDVAHFRRRALKRARRQGGRENPGTGCEMIECGAMPALLAWAALEFCGICRNDPKYNIPSSRLELFCAGTPGRPESHISPCLTNRLPPSISGRTVFTWKSAASSMGRFTRWIPSRNRFAWLAT